MEGIGIANRYFDLDGAVVIRALPEDFKIRNSERRVTRTKTLDGGVSFVDGGVTAGDRTFDIKVELTEVLWATLWAIFSAASWVVVSTKDACYLAKFNRITENGKNISMQFLISSDLTVDA